MFSSVEYIIILSDFSSSSQIYLEHGYDSSPEVVECPCVDVHAFGSVTDFFLSQLIADLGLQPKEGEDMPTITMAKVDMLVRHLLPDLTDDEVAETLAQRAMSRRRHDSAPGRGSSSSMHAEAVAVMEGLCDPSDHIQARHAADEACEETAAAARVLRYLHLKGYRVPASMEQLQKKKEVASAVDRAQTERAKTFIRLTRTEANRYLPQEVKGVVIQPYPKSSKFQVYYPTMAPPCSRTERYGPQGNSEAKALALCCEWAWAHHTEQTGEKCPYVFHR